MTSTIDRLHKLLNLGSKLFSELSLNEVTFKATPKKWSKKEILGHLIDSAINNLQRFTEIQFEPKPYTIKPYNQNGLVIANDYQNSELSELVNIWLALNHRISKLMALQTKATLNYEITLGDGTISDLKFLMDDYVDHMEHHIKQIQTINS
ncbi:DinB family protein [Seonamhaeicola marinus]|uniref:DinB family protein n=1 Tax=Seonamhaeicola marinus TaxID=1912246 RepID=A0A5D0HSS9_9FLAO|nr:DinB family protein [Seonamhaeicola marinus]TYA74374.1 DinB family protein [Seonamhaeicola marinus]